MCKRQLGFYSVIHSEDMILILIKSKLELDVVCSHTFYSVNLELYHVFIVYLSI
jgi:hypothetical protein